MQGLTGLAILLGLQTIGELASRLLGLPFPGPVIGMLLLPFVLTIPAVREPVATCAKFLLAHLSLLFVPVGVGVMTHFDLVTKFGTRILLVVVLSTAIGILVTALTLHWLRGSRDA